MYCWRTREIHWLLFSDWSCKNIQPTIFLWGRPQLHWVLLVLSINWFQIFLQIIHVLENLSVDLKTKEDNKSVTELPKCVPWSVFVDKKLVPFSGRSHLRQFLPSKPHKMGFNVWGRSGVSGFLRELWHVPRRF